MDATAAHLSGCRVFCYSSCGRESLSRFGFISRRQCSPSVKVAHCRTSLQIKVESLRFASKRSIVCRASSSGPRRNPDFSRQNKPGFSRSRDRQNGDKNHFENVDEPELISSKNGALHSFPDIPKHQATATPGPREKEIVELFRKVQAQLRERAAIKEEKKIEALQGKDKENGTVDSLLKLLRKHSVEQGKRSHTNDDSREFINRRPAPNGRLNGDEHTNSLKPPSSVKDEPKQHNATSPHRPVSKFQKKSPVPHVYTRQDATNSFSQIKRESVIETDPDDLDSELEQELDHHEPEPEIESLLSNMTILHEAASSDEDNDESEIEEEAEPEKDEKSTDNADLSSLKLTELRALAKVRGLKGFSKLKKCELVKLLS